MKYLFLFFVGVTLFFSFSPGHVTPAIIVNNDKLTHFVVFFGLTFGLSISFSDFSVKKLFFIMVLLAAGIESFQFLFANREFSLVDFGAGFAGVFVYLIMLRITSRMLKVFEVVFRNTL